MNNLLLNENNEEWAAISNNLPKDSLTRPDRHNISALATNSFHQHCKEVKEHIDDDDVHAVLNHLRMMRVLLSLVQIRAELL